MQLWKKALKSLIIGTLVGTGIALFTNFFFQELIDRFENLTYDMRYSWEYDEGESQLQQDQNDYGLYIIDIDDRSQAKMGMYWNWDRSYHAQLIKNLQKFSPAAIAFDILF